MRHNSLPEGEGGGRSEEYFFFEERGWVHSFKENKGRISQQKIKEGLRKIDGQLTNYRGLQKYYIAL